MTTTKTLLALNIDLPPGFTGMPVSDDEELNLRTAWAISQRVAAAAGKTPEEFGGYLVSLVPAMRRTNIRVFGKFAVGDGPDFLATLTLALVPFPETEPLESVAGALADIYRRRHPRAEVRLVDLPAGPAMAAIEGGEFRLPPELTGNSVEEVRTQIKAMYQIPWPDGRSVVMLSVIAESEQAWPAVAEATARIANSLRRAPR